MTKTNQKFRGNKNNTASSTGMNKQKQKHKTHPNKHTSEHDTNDNEMSMSRAAAKELSQQQRSQQHQKRLQTTSAMKSSSKLSFREKVLAASSVSSPLASTFVAGAPTTLADLVARAQSQQEAFDRQNQLLGASASANAQSKQTDCSLDSKSNRVMDNSLKSFYKEVRKVIDASDVLIEVLDARDPIGSRSPQVEEMIAAASPPKKLVLLLNKIDLVPKDNILEWLKYLRREYPTVAFKSSTQNQNNRLAQSNVRIDQADEHLLQSSKCLGADILVRLLSNYTRINDVKQTITVGIIGFPNVGKSSIINSLKRSHACQSGSTPGLTKIMQEIKLDKHIKLLDSPGIVMSRDESLASLALKNCVKIESLDDPTMPVDLLIRKLGKYELAEKYDVSSDFTDASQFLHLIARKYGKLKRNDISDLAAAAHIVLNDWNGGRLHYFTRPPANNNVIETKIVSEMQPAFDIDALLREEEEILFETMIDDNMDDENDMENDNEMKTS